MQNQRFRVLAALFLSVVGVWWFSHDVDWAGLSAVLAGIDVKWVVLASVALLGEFFIRALRWQILLRPLGTHARMMDLWSATVIGAAVNTLLPLRAGEIAKPVVASRRTGYPLSSVFATNVMERVFDLLGMVSVLVMMVVLLPQAPGDDQLVVNLHRYGSMFGVFAVVSLGIFFLLATRETAARKTFERILSIAPAAVQAPFLELFDGFVLGLGSTRDRRGLLQAGGLSITMWLNGALAIYFLFLAFDVELPFAAACFTGVAIALTVALPQAPGFIGVFHVAIEKTMVLWGMDPNPAKGFALIFWAVSFVPVTLVGLGALWREGLSVSGLARMDPDKAEE